MESYEVDMALFVKIIILFFNFFMIVVRSVIENLDCDVFSVVGFFCIGWAVKDLVECKFFLNKIVFVFFFLVYCFVELMIVFEYIFCCFCYLIDELFLIEC